MKRIVLALMLLCAACVPAAAQTVDAAAEEKRRDIKRLLELSRGAELGAEIVRQSIEELRSGLTILPEPQRDKVIKIFEEEMLKEFNPATMAEMVVPIYDKHLSAEDVKALIDFYQTPLGKKMLDTLPQIMREAYDAGAERGRVAGLRAMARVTAEGILPTPAAAAEELTKPVSPKQPVRRRATRRRNR
jgi:uncharacterized protein